jgi:hypothetical protein
VSREQRRVRKQQAKMRGKRRVSKQKRNLRMHTWGKRTYLSSNQNKIMG